MTSIELTGLTEAEVANRRQQGLGNNQDSTGGRTYASIIRTNVFSPFNLILFSIGIALLSLGRTSDALFSVGLGIFNSCVSTFQEIRAKRKLDSITLLNRPRIKVLRGGETKEVDPSELVKGDIINIESGEQVVVDGRMISDERLEMDESLLTGETDLIRKTTNDPLMSGSFCITGKGYYEAEAVGEASFANQLTATAKQFQILKTPLQLNIDFLVRILMLIVLVMSVLIFVGAFVDDLEATKLVQIAAVLTGQVPYGLFTLIVIAYALGATTITQKGAMVQQSNAIESLSNIDVLCTDKTGTLTANRLQFNELFVAEGVDHGEGLKMLGEFVRGASGTNKTGEAIIAGTPGETYPTTDEILFSSARKWSAVAFDQPARKGTYVMGAVEMLKPYLPAEAIADESRLMQQVSAWSDQGLRVLLFAMEPNTTVLHDGDGNPSLPQLRPVGVLSLSDELRPQVKETIQTFTDLGIKLKVISGDNPNTVASLAKQAGLPDDIQLFSGPELAAASEAEFKVMADEGTIFGRITPDQKEKLVNSLLEDGKYVAMIGDGVNDVLSLKKASLGIAMQSGSSATRNVADMVLIDDSFAALEPAFDEGRKIIGGISNSLYLFITRALSSMLVIIASVMVSLPFPFDPAQVALVSYTVGAPSFFMTILAQREKLQKNLIVDIFRFAIPIAIITMLIGVFGYLSSYNTVLDVFDTVYANERIPDRVIESYASYTGVTISDDNFVESYATIFAQTVLSLYLGITSMLVVFFLAPPFKFFAVWTGKLTHDWRIPAINVGLMIALVIFYFSPWSEWVGLLPVPEPAIQGILTRSALWLVLVWLTFRFKLFDRFIQFSPEK